MADITVTVTPDGISGYSSWTMLWTVTDTSNDAGPASADLPVIVVPSDATPDSTNSFTANRNKWFTTPYDQNYVTWRSLNSDDQFPQSMSGKSVDIWSTKLYERIGNGDKWIDIVNNSPYPLSDNKWTLFYDYDVPYSPYYSKTGTVSFVIQ
jgi:hypothetical protein